MKKNELVGFKTTKAEKNLIRDLAKAQGYPSQSELIRTVLGAYLVGLAMPGSASLAKNLNAARGLH